MRSPPTVFPSLSLSLFLSFLRCVVSCAPLEDFQKEGGCPAYKAVDGFEIDKYMGIW